MELYKELLIELLKDDSVNIRISFPQINVEKIISEKCYQALVAIKNILNDPNLDDSTCFSKIEEIVCLLEALGTNGGSRHDF